LHDDDRWLKTPYENITRSTMQAMAAKQNELASNDTLGLSVVLRLNFMHSFCG